MREDVEPLGPDETDDQSNQTLPPGLTLLEQLDRRQNEALLQLDQLEGRVQRLVNQLQAERSGKSRTSAA